MAKLVATDTAMKVTTDAVQVLVERDIWFKSKLNFMRDAKILQYTEGIMNQRLIIAGHILK